MAPQLGRNPNGTGSVYFEAARSRWIASITVAGGKRRRWTAATEREAKQLLRKAILDQEQGTLPSIDRQTVAEYLTQWHADMQASLRPRVWIRYGQYVRQAIDGFGSRRLTQLTSTEIQALYSKRLAAGASPTTVRHLHTVLHGALQRAVQPFGPLLRNPTDGTRPPAMAHKPMHTLTAAQVRTFLTATRDERDHALYVLALTEAMREGELLGLHWRDVDLERGVLHIRSSLQRVTGQGFVFTPPKTAGSQRPIRLNKHALEALKRHRQRQDAERLVSRHWQEQDLVFPTRTGKPQDTPALVQRGLYPLLEKYGLPRVTFHELRHSAATLLLERGIHPKLVAELLGHSRVALTLDRYSHVSMDLQQVAAEAMDAMLEE